MEQEFKGKEAKVSEAKTGKICPNCGAQGKYHGVHETAVRNYTLPQGKVVDVGWRCWNCAYEWGFEIGESDGTTI